MVIYRRTISGEKEVKEVSVDLSEILAFLGVLNLIGLPWIWLTRESVNVWSLVLAGAIWLVITAATGANAMQTRSKR